MKELLDFFKEFDLHTLISVALVVWYFTKGIKKEVQEIHKDLRIMNSRVSRLEGTVYGTHLYDSLKKDT